MLYACSYQKDIEDNKEDQHPKVSVGHVQSSPKTDQSHQSKQIQHHGHLWRTNRKTLQLSLYGQISSFGKKKTTFPKSAQWQHLKLIFLEKSQKLCSIVCRFMHADCAVLSVLHAPLPAAMGAVFSYRERAGQACFSFSIVQTSFSHADRALWTMLALAWEPCGHVYWPWAGVQDGCQRKQTNQNNKRRRIKWVVSLSRL